MERYAVIGGLVFLLLILWEINRENHRFVITHYQIITKKRMHSSIRIAFLSDLHGKEYGAGNTKLLQAIKEAKPDYILIGGDMLVGAKEIPCETAARFVEQLPAIAPVYYANGNHEQKIRLNAETIGSIYEMYQKRLEEAGIHWLVNDSWEVEAGGEKLRITGTEIPGECFKRFLQKELEVEEIEAQVGSASSDAYQILLAHHPKYARAYQAWGADLILSGHLHGGVARLPLKGGIGVISPQIRLFPKYSGDCYDLGVGCHLVVSKGLGTHTINVRLMNPAELIILDITGEN